MITNQTEFTRELEKVNEWWTTGQVQEAKEFPIKREIYAELEKEFSNRRIIFLLGPRRVGKSVLLKQAIDTLIKSGINPYSILYYSLDDPSLFAYSDNLIKDLLDYHEENIAPAGERRFVFLDEVHSFPDWHKWIKAYYDRNLPLKFILTGSSSLALQKEANKYLRGRSFEFSLYPLNLKEFLKFTGFEEMSFNLNEIDRLRPLEVSKLWRKIKKTFAEYLLVGGFPEWFQVKTAGVEAWFQKLVNDIPKKAIYEDIAKLFGIKSPRLLELIFTYIVSHQSKVLAYETINEIAELDRLTLVNYIEFLKSSYLLIEILKFAKLKEQLKAKKKFLAVDQGIRNAILKDYQIKEENAGFIVENMVGIKCFSFKERNVSYWKINGEVDFVLNNKEILPVEVKYRDRITDKDLTGLLNFMAKTKAKKGLVVTKDIYQKRIIDKKEIHFIPAFLFLLAE